MDIESYLKDLSPELQEKARACESTNELRNLAEQEGVALPPEALAKIAGGSDVEGSKCVNWPCPKCKSWNTEYRGDVDDDHMREHCNNCGHNWIQRKGDSPI